MCIGVGGDILPGTDLREALAVLEHDPDTDAIALIGEIGGIGEIEAADWYVSESVLRARDITNRGRLGSVNTIPEPCRRSEWGDIAALLIPLN